MLRWLNIADVSVRSAGPFNLFRHSLSPASQAPKGSRLATLRPWQAWGVLLGLFAFIAYAFTIHAPLLTSGPNLGFDDTDLYRAIARRVALGQGYYPAAAAEQRAYGYPTAPALAFREPTLAWLMAALRTDLWRKAVLYALALGAGLAVLQALERAGASFLQRLFCMALMATGLGIVLIRGMLFIHETWAGLLIALSLAVYSPRRWAPAVALGVMACLIRELALPYLLAMAAVALWERRWREALGWTLGIATFAALFAVHMTLASQLHAAGDATSAGWLGRGGIPYVLGMARINLALIIAPTPLVAIPVAAALLGFAGARNPVAVRAAVVVGGYMAAFLFVGRANNNYWGGLYAPILPLGLALSPPALRDLLRAAVARPQ